MSFRLHDIRISTLELRRQLEAHPELFGVNPNRVISPTSPHREGQDIWVRYNSLDRMGPAYNEEHQSVWHPASAQLPAAREIAMQLMSAMEGEVLGGILITRLPKGGMIYPHIDRGWHAGYYDKFYLPIKTNPGDRFCFEAGCIEPSYGQVWEFDNSCLHWVDNAGETDRMALIICIRTHARELRCPNYQTGLTPVAATSWPR